MSTTATRKPKAATNRAALREAVAAFNEGRPEDCPAPFLPEAEGASSHTARR